ncbi:hypothetical protein MT325_m781R [Paramecium bursaria chlorella virus MT325]|uniref:Uncharacterized protein m781R n=1 Tax=Paramecium bursaria Chlorella virus MT325 TaxID=346932 RepID=A7IVG1_PBCVM|nr:hypothetical protein MT325_m781R [Paramecium bursaria chlorella virus MT325]
MMGFQIHGKGPLPASTLVGVGRCGVKHLQHRHDAIGLAIGSANLSPTTANVAHVETNATAILGQLGNVSKALEDVGKRVIAVNQEATCQVCLLEARVEKSGTRVGKLASGKSIICLLYAFNVRTP